MELDSQREHHAETPNDKVFKTHFEELLNNPNIENGPNDIQLEHKVQAFTYPSLTTPLNPAKYLMPSSTSNQTRVVFLAGVFTFYTSLLSVVTHIYGTFPS